MALLVAFTASSIHLTIPVQNPVSATHTGTVLIAQVRFSQGFLICLEKPPYTSQKTHLTHSL